MTKRLSLLTLVVAGSILFAGAKNASAQACTQTSQCPGQVCDRVTSTCAPLVLTLTPDVSSPTAVSVRPINNAKVPGTVNVYGCLGSQTICAGLPFSDPAWSSTQIDVPSNCSIAGTCLGIKNLRGNRSYRMTVAQDFQSTNAFAYAESPQLLTLPGTQFTPTVSNITGTTARVSWTTNFSGDSVVHYGIQPPRWTKETLPAAVGGINAIIAISTGEAWAVGTNGVALHRPDDSQVNRTWTAGSGMGSTYLTGVDTIDGSLIWAVGMGGIAYRSSDRGQNWTVSSSTIGDTLNAVHTARQGTAWVAGVNERIAFFNGSTWQPKRSSLNGRTLYAIYSHDNQRVWAVGSNRTLLYSSNQGANWDATTQLPGNTVQDGRTIASYDGQTIWVGGTGGNLWKYDGVSWSIVPAGTGDTIDDITMIGPEEFYFIAGNRIGRYLNGAFSYETQVVDASGLGTSPRAMTFAHGAKGIVVGTNSVASYDIPDYAQLGTGTLNHVVDLDGLANNTPYYVAAITTGSGIAQGAFTSFQTVAPDTIAPDISLTDPTTDPFYTRTNTYVIRGTISDNLRLNSFVCEDVTNHNMVSPALITVTPGLPVTSPAGVSATWQANVNLGTIDGSTRFTCTVSDGNNVNNRSVSVTIIRDTVAPVLNVTNPEPFSTTTFTGDPLALEGDVTDVNPLDRLEYILNAGTPTSFAAPAANGPWATTMTGMIVGENNLTVHAYDKAGNRGIAGHTFEYAEPTFELTATPTPQTISAGQKATYTATITPKFGFTGLVDLSLTGNPANSSVTFQPAQVNVGATAVSSTIEIQTGAAPTGTFTMTLTGQRGTVSVSTPIVLTIITPPNFTLTASPASRTVFANTNTTYTIGVSANDTYSGTVDNFVVRARPNNPLPTGISATFTPASLTLANNQNLSTSLRLNTTSATPSGTHLLRVYGTDQAKGLTNYIDITLVVDLPPDVTLTVLPGTQTLVAGSGTAANYAGKAIALNGYNKQSTVTATVGSAIPGLAISLSPSNFVPAAGPNGTDFVVSVTADSRVPGATHNLVVTLAADDGTFTKDVTVQLIITGDVTPPIISIVQADVNPNFDRATVAWRTNEPANAQLEVYSDPSRTAATLVGISGVNTFDLSRNVLYVGLAPQTTYYLRVISIDQAPTANRATRDTFDDGQPLLLTTLDEPDNIQPTITITAPTDGMTLQGSVAITGVAADNKELRTITLKVERPDPATPGNWIESFTQTFNPVATSGYNFTATWNTLTGRVNGTYRISAQATDKAGNLSLIDIVMVDVQNDLTKPRVSDGYPQAINLICGSPVYSNPDLCQITIVWETDDASTSMVEYAENDAYFANGYGLTISRDDNDDPAASASEPVHQNHKITIPNLARGFLYHYRVWSCNISGDCNND